MKLGKTYFSGSLTFDEGNNVIGPSSASFESITVSNTLNVTGNITGAATTASYVEFTDIANKPTLISSSNQLAGETVDGDLTVTGKITAQEFHTEFVSASILYDSGSTQFGNSADDTHTFTGTGSFDILGVNTSSPSTALHTVGKIRASKQSNPSAYIQLSADELTSNYNADILLNDTGLTFKHNSNSRGFVFDRNGSVHMLINSTGFVGLGTSSPSVNLDIERASNVIVDLNTTTADANTTIRFQESGNNKATIGYEGTANGLVLTTGGFTAGNGIFIDDLQNVGIGTASPSRQLEIYGTNDGYLKVDGGRVDNHGYTLGSDAYGFIVYDDTAASYRFTIDQDTGNVGIGTVSPRAKLDINVASNSGQATTLANSVTYAGLYLNADAGNGSNNFRIGESGAGSYYIQVSNSAGTTPYPINLNPFGGAVNVGTTSSVGKFTVSNGAAGNSTASGASVVNNAGTGVNIFPSLDTGNYNTLISSGDSFIAGNGQYSPIAIGSHDGSSIRVSRYDIKFATNNALKATLNSDGNLGLGTTTPGAKLHVNGSQILNGDLTIPYSTAAVTNTIGIETSPTNPFSLTAKSLVIQGANAYQAGTPTQAQAGGDVFIKGGYGVVNTGLGAYAGDVSIEGGVTHDSSTTGAGSVIFKTAAAERMNIAADGTIKLPYAFVTGGLNSGAGVITDPGTYTGMRLYGQGDGNLKIFNVRNNSAYGNIMFYTGTGTERMRIQHDGNVGIGTTVANTALKVAGVIQATDEIQIAKDPSDSVGVGPNLYLVGGTGSSYTQLAQGVGRFTIWGFDGSSWGEKMTIRHSDGNVGVGTTNPNAKFVIRQDAAGDVTLLRLQNRSGAGSEGAFIGFSTGYNTSALIGAQREGAENDSSLIFSPMLNESAVERMRILSNGSVGIGTTAPTAKLEVVGRIYSAGESGQRTYTPRHFYLGHPGNTGNFTRSINIESDIGQDRRGGIVQLIVHTWQNEHHFGLITWNNAGGSGDAITVVYTPISTSGDLQVSVALNGSVGNQIDITFTNAHSNSHGWQAYVMGLF